LIKHEISGNAEETVEVVACADLEISTVIQSSGIPACNCSESATDVNRETMILILREGAISKNEQECRNQ
jgi:hypothetical protein